ncbi:RCC1 [Scenedesmus sp. PABB004]|nr:RCC1 [Scenedesmus sp. PABB004]
MAPKRKESRGGEGAKRRRLLKEFLLPTDLTPGYAFTVGTNGFGALGLGEDVVEKFRAAHVDVAGKRLLSVACGGMHTVALAEDGSVWTWGVNDEGALGRPTAGTAWEGEPESSKEDPYVPGAARLPAGLAVVQVAAGDGFTFALTDAGAVWGWGQFKDDLSSFYSFAPGVSVQRLPALVYAPPDVRGRVRKLAAGARHMLALTRRGDVLSWGIGGQGQLGRLAPYGGAESGSFPGADALLTPRPVEGLAAALGPGVADIGTGHYGSYAISARGAVAAWGLNNGGQLALPVAAEQDAEQCVWAPTAVPALARGVAAVAGGEHHALALTRRGQVLSFGSTNYGMLGRSRLPQPVDKETILLPEPAPVDGADGLADEAVTAVAAGMHVSAAVTAGGNAFTWGSNVNYQMAKGQDEDDNALPTRMRRHKAFGNRRVLQWSFGGQHAALLASADDGDAGAAGGSPAAAAPPAGGGAGTSAAAAAPAPAAPAAPAAAGEGAGESEAPAKGKRGRGKAAPKEGAAPAKKRRA